MWKVFVKSNSNLIDSIEIFESWKSFCFKKMETTVKEHFAKQVVVFFDNQILTSTKNEIHESLLLALHMAEKNTNEYKNKFKTINAFLFMDKENFFIVTEGLQEQKQYYPIAENGFGFSIYSEDVCFSEDRRAKLEHNSLSSLVFDLSLCNFVRGWVNHVPDLITRAKLQTAFMLCKSKNKNEVFFTQDMEELAGATPLFNQVFEKVLRVMPKVEQSLLNEWQVIHNEQRLSFKIRQANKIK